MEGEGCLHETQGCRAKRLPLRAAARSAPCGCLVKPCCPNWDSAAQTSNQMASRRLPLLLMLRQLGRQAVAVHRGWCPPTGGPPFAAGATGGRAHRQCRRQLTAIAGIAVLAPSAALAMISSRWGGGGEGQWMLQREQCLQRWLAAAAALCCRTRFPPASLPVLAPRPTASSPRLERLGAVW